MNRVMRFSGGWRGIGRPREMQGRWHGGGTLRGELVVSPKTSLRKPQNAGPGTLLLQPRHAWSASRRTCAGPSSTDEPSAGVLAHRRGYAVVSVTLAAPSTRSRIL